MSRPGSSGSRIRIDSSDVSVSLATMRSTVLGLFVDAHEFKALEHFRRTRTSIKGDITSGYGRLRHLVVDLVAPSFSTLPPEDQQLFLPPHMSPARYAKARMMLDFYAVDVDLAVLKARDLQQESAIAVDIYPGETIHVLVNGCILVLGDFVIYPGCDPADLMKEYRGCNADQQAAVRSVLSAQDYALIQGFPGTGKSKVIALLVRILVARGERVLLSAYTHSAVDNVLMKLKGKGLQFPCVIRVGAEDAVHVDVRSYRLRTEFMTRMAELTGLLSQVRLKSYIIYNVYYTLKHTTCVVLILYRFA